MEQDQTQEQPSNQLATISILYVEDEEIIVKAMSRFLKRSIGTVHVAQNGAEGLELFLQHRPDIVITDIQMPIMNGLEMAAEIRNIDTEVPIILTTAFNEINYLAEAIELGVDKYIKKPIDYTVLTKAIKKAAAIIVQKQELEAKNRVIQTILDWHPAFSILTDPNNLQIVNRRLLDFFEYETMDDFLSEHPNLRDVLMDVNDPKCEKSCQNDKSICESIIDASVNGCVVQFKCKKDKKVYRIRHHHFNELNQYLFAFTEIDTTEPCKPSECGFARNFLI